MRSIAPSCGHCRTMHGRRTGIWRPPSTFRQSTSSERVRALRAEGVIRGYHADVDFDALGRHVQALTAVTIRPPTRDNVEAFRTWVAGLPELVGVFVVSGTADFLLHVAVPDTNALYAFVIDRLTSRAEVADVNTSVVYEHIRPTVVEP